MICPVCGAEEGACADTYIDPGKVLQEDGMANTRAVDGSHMRFPQQQVREGRGVPGYTAREQDVEVYDPNTGKTLRTVRATKKSRSPSEDK